METPTPTPWEPPESRPWPLELAALAKERAAVEEEARAPPPPPDAMAYARLEMPEPRSALQPRDAMARNPFL